MQTPDPTDEVGSAEIRSVADLEQYFERGAKDRARWKLGVEYEKPVVDAVEGGAVPYQGKNGIRTLLEGLRERTGWTPILENDSIIGLQDGKASITLEPGGQLEMSGQQCDSLHCADDELSRHVEAIVAVGSKMGLSFLGLGISPKTPLVQMPWMPKERYRIMRRIMAETGKLGHRMMQQTATVQGNFDYGSEADARKKLRLAMAAAPILVAVSANSAVVDGHPSGYKSYRAHIWSQTDPARCGLLPFAFDTQNIFGAYTQYALDVPMYFLYREGKYEPSRGKTFREFLDGRIPGFAPRLSDWSTHLTTLFPEARLKTYIEVRAADSQMPRLMLATPALMKGLLYDDDCLDAAWDVVARWPFGQRVELGEAAARDGLQAAVGRHTLRDYARDLVAIALEGLRRQRCVNSAGKDETMYLEPLAQDVDDGICPSDRTIENWEGAWAGDIQRLIAASAYTPEMTRAA